MKSFKTYKHTLILLIFSVLGNPICWAMEFQPFEKDDTAVNESASISEKRKSPEKEKKEIKVESPPKKQKLKEDHNRNSEDLSELVSDNSLVSSPFSLTTTPQRFDVEKISISEVKSEKGIWRLHLNYTLGEKHFDTFKWHLKTAQEIKKTVENLNFTEKVNFAKVRIEALYQTKKGIKRKTHKPAVTFSSRKIESENDKSEFITFSHVADFDDEKGKSILSQLLGRKVEDDSKEGEESNFKKRYYHTEPTVLEYVLRYPEWIEKIKPTDSSYKLAYLVFSISSYFDPCPNCLSAFSLLSLKEEYFLKSLKEQLDKEKLPLEENFSVFVNVSSITKYYGSRQVIKDNPPLYMDPIPLEKISPHFAQMHVLFSPENEDKSLIPSYVQPTVKLEFHKEFEKFELSKLLEEGRYYEAGILLYLKAINEPEEVKNELKELSSRLQELIKPFDSLDKKEIFKKIRNFAQAYSDEKKAPKYKEYNNPQEILDDLLSFASPYGEKSREYTVVSLFKKTCNTVENKKDRDKKTATLLSEETCKLNGEKISEEADLGFILKVFGWMYLKDNINESTFPIPEKLKATKKKKNNVPEDKDNNINFRLEKIMDGSKSQRLQCIAKYLHKKFNEGSCSIENKKYYWNEKK